MKAAEEDHSVPEEKELTLGRQVNAICTKIKKNNDATEEIELEAIKAKWDGKIEDAAIVRDRRI